MALNFNQLPGRPLPNLQYGAGLCRTQLRKTHAVPIRNSFVNYLTRRILSSRPDNPNV